MNPKLSLEIGADIKGMEAALERADQLLTQHQNNYKRVQSAISQNTQKTQQLEKSISQLNNEFKRGNISQAQYSKESDRLSAELREASKETSDYQRELRRLDREMDRVAQSSANYSKASQQTATASTNAAAGMGRMSRSASARATPAMMSLGQVMQDAPYGIQGVANNIQQLTMQLGYLSRHAGGTKGAMKALVSSLMGPAGILIAVSAVTSAMVAFGNSGIRLSDILNFVTGNTNKAAQAQRKLSESYRQAESDVMAEMAVLNSLIEVAKDETKSRKERQRAIDAVNDKFPELHENLRLETINSDKAREAVDRLTNSLLRQAKIEGVKGLIAETYAEIAEISQKSAIDSASYWDIFKAAISPAGTQVQSLILSGIEEQGEQAIKTKNKLEQYSKVLKDLLSEDITAEGVFTSTDPTGGTTTEPVEVPFEFPEPSMTAEEAQEAIDFARAEMEKDGLKVPVVMDALDEANFYSDLNQKREAFFAEGEEGWKEHTEKIKEFTNEQRLQAQLLAQAFSAMANQLIEGLVEGQMSMGDFVKSMIKMIGKMLVSIAAQAIANSVLSATQTAAASGPAAALVLPGLLGAATAATKSALPAFADGGIVGGNSLYGDKILARLNSKELVLNTDQQKKLYKQLEAPKVVAMNNSEPIVIGGAIEARGDVLRVVLDRSEKRRGRTT